MSDPKDNKLIVNLGASEARRRLKGFGHGVGKVQSAGRNQAVVIHRATGPHLQELEAKFADVGFSSSLSRNNTASPLPATETSFSQPNSGILAATLTKTQIDRNTLEFG